MSSYEWTDDFDSIGDLDDFIATMHGEPTEAQLRALGLYSTRVGQSVERRLAGELRTHARPLPERRKAKRLRVFYALLWLAKHHDMILFAAASVGLWLALNWAAK